ncbi:glycosyltransferase [Streptomyces sp. NPDC001848]|uniref:tetratricopeptide repeat-containing glycosyltransferase n=1 Tax=Streptomyces sp. NPDC001848 TaxID=3364618 RepID=UPI00368DDD96
MKQTVCLNMIVKDEAPVIRRCLESVRPLIDTWVIVDTGSTDGTQDVIRDVFSDLPGALYERSWKGYDGSRTEAIELARASADYLLFMDADDVLEVEPGFVLPELVFDAYMIAIHHGPVIFKRPALASTRLPWRYTGVLHEYLHLDFQFTLTNLEGAHIRTVDDGARHRKEGVRKKYLRDAETLQQALVKEPDNERYVMYLGQSWAAADEWEKALEAYDRRAVMGGWDEEVYWARFTAARIAEKLERPLDEVMDRYLRAYESRPSRAEALGELARHCRMKGRRWPLAYMFARQASEIPYPTDVMYVESEWYEWRVLDELAVSAFAVGEFEESKSCSKRLLECGKLPERHRARVMQNLELAQLKLGSGEHVGA